MLIIMPMKLRPKDYITLSLVFVFCTRFIVLYFVHCGIIFLPTSFILFPATTLSIHPSTYLRAYPHQNWILHHTGMQHKKRFSATIYPPSLVDLILKLSSSSCSLSRKHLQVDFPFLYSSSNLTYHTFDAYHSNDICLPNKGFCVAAGVSTTEKAVEIIDGLNLKAAGI